MTVSSRLLYALSLGVMLTPLSFTSALAGVGTVSSPYVEKGALAVESLTVFGFDYDDDREELEQELELEYGFTERLQGDIEAEFKKENDKDTDFEKIGLGLRYELTEPGTYVFDSAITLGYDISMKGGADSVGAGLNLARQGSEFETIVNIGIDHEVGDDSADGIELDAALGVYMEKENWGTHGWEIGAEYFADFGNLDDDNGWDEQEHYIGPVAGSEFEIGQGRVIEYNFGYFQGLSDAAKDGTVKLEVELEF